MSTEPINIIKIGGNVIDNPDTLAQFLTDFAQVKGLKILVHGGENWLQKWLKVYIFRNK